MEQLLFKLGIPSYSLTLYTTLDGSLTISIAAELPKTIGWIYGLSVYADGVTPDNKPLITTTDAQNLFVSLMDGQNQFYQEVRLTDFLNQFTGVPTTRPNTYLPVSIGRGVDLSTSKYLNPLLVNNKTIALKVNYISLKTYRTMVKKKMLLVNAEEMADIKVEE